MPRTWRGRAEEAGTILHDWGAHLVDHALQLGLGPCRRLVAWIFDSPWEGIDSGGHGRIVLEFDEAIFQAETSRICRIDRPRWWIVGTDGGFVKYGIDPQEEALRAGDIDRASEPESHQGILRRSLGSSEVVESRIPSIRAHWDSYYANIAAHLTGREPLAVTAEQAREVVRVLEAATRSVPRSRHRRRPLGILIRGGLESEPAARRRPHRADRVSRLPASDPDRRSPGPVQPPVPEVLGDFELVVPVGEDEAVIAPLEAERSPNPGLAGSEESPPVLSDRSRKGPAGFAGRHFVRIGCRAGPLESSAATSCSGFWATVPAAGRSWPGRSLDNPAVLKVLAADRRTGSVFRARHVREAFAAAQIRHPNLIAIREVDAHRGHHYARSSGRRAVAGRGLARVAGRARPAAVMILQAARGLKAAHGRDSGTGT